MKKINKITFLASLSSRGSQYDTDFATLSVLDDPKNDEFFKTVDEKTFPKSGIVHLNYILSETKFIDGIIGTGTYQITIEKTDEKPEKREVADTESSLQ